MSASFQTERWAELCDAAISEKLSRLPAPPGLAKLTSPIQAQIENGTRSQLTLSGQFEIDGLVQRFQEKERATNQRAPCANRCSDELVTAAAASGSGLLDRCRLRHRGLAGCGRRCRRRFRGT